MAIAIKPFYNNNTRDMVNPGDRVFGCSETELHGLARSGLVRLARHVSDPVATVSADAAADAVASVPGTVPGRAVATKRSLRSALGVE